MKCTKLTYGLKLNLGNFQSETIELVYETEAGAALDEAKAIEHAAKTIGTSCQAVNGFQVHTASEAKEMMAEFQAELQQLAGSLQNMRKAVVETGATVKGKLPRASADDTPAVSEPQSTTRHERAAENGTAIQATLKHTGPKMDLD